MKVLSCFAGIGGFDLGFERAGMETVAHVEIDKYASHVFARHFPNSKHYEDIRAFTDVPSVDLVRAWQVGPALYMATVMDNPDPQVLVMTCTIPAGSSICIPVHSTGEGMYKAEQFMSGLGEAKPKE